MKSIGRLIWPGRALVINEAEVNTQPVPATASSRPKTIIRASWGRQAVKAVPRPAGSPRSRARLTA